MPTVDIQKDIRNFIITNFLFGRAEALHDNDLLLGNIIDSSGALELIIFLQEHFGIIVEDREIGVPDNFGTLRGIVAFVSKKLHAVENT